MISPARTWLRRRAAGLQFQDQGRAGVDAQPRERDRIPVACQSQSLFDIQFIRYRFRMDLNAFATQF
jgi:hypothetical protein